MRFHRCFFGVKMNYTEKIFIKLISAAIHEKKVGKIDFDLVDSDKLIKLSKDHKNPAMVYAGMQYYNAPEKLEKIFKEGLRISVLAYSKLISVEKLVGEILNNEDISYIIVKGSSVAKYYANPEFRSMSDVDFVLHYHDKENAEKILKEHGAIFHPEDCDEYNTAGKLKNKNIELHYKLGYHAYLSKKYNYQKFFEQIWNHIESKEELTYELDYHYNFIYNIFHMANHFYKNGCGIRMITDIGVMIKNKPDDADWKQIMEDLSLIGLKEFAIKIMKLNQEWFDICLPEIDIDWEQVKCPMEVQEYIMNAGVFGFSNVSEDIGSIRTSSHHGFLSGLLKWAFPSYKHMRQYNEWFQDKPAIFLPIAYIERLKRNAKERGGLIIWLRSLKKGKKANDYHDNILKIMELE